MNVYIARQPIFNKHQKVYAYELLYRSGQENSFDASDGDNASSKVITNSLLLFGLDTITGGKKAFINFTQNLLKDEVATSLPKELVTIEILENVTVDDEVIEACKKLKNAGYQLALDDFVFSPQYQPLIALADIIKIDFLNTAPEIRSALPRVLSSSRVKFLAEKIETKDDFYEALELGYIYFQGYFFCKPEIIIGKDLPTYKLTYLQLVQQVNQPEIDFDKIEHIIKQDVALSFKLLKYINSAAFGFQSKIHSIKNALVMLGVREISKWVSLIALKGMGDDKPDELVMEAVVRGRFCELLAPELGMASRSQDLFLLGMFSLIDAFMDRPKIDILAELPIDGEIKDALLGIENSFFEALDLVISYKEGRWEKVDQYTTKYHFHDSLLPDLFLQCLAWVDRIFS